MYCTIDDSDFKIYYFNILYLKIKINILKYYKMILCN